MTREECEHWQHERLGPDKCRLDIPVFSACCWPTQFDVDGGCAQTARYHECPRSVAYRRGLEAQEKRGAQ